MSKPSKRRFCPAIQREITSADCGENRASRYACPEQCTFNPFSPAQYDAFLEIEGGLIGKNLDWFLSVSPNPAEALRQLQRVNEKAPVERGSWQIREMFFTRGPGGRTPAEQWLDAGFRGLKNDERIIQNAIMQLRPRLLEVQRVLDDLRIEVVDLLDAERKAFLICDRLPLLAVGVCGYKRRLAIRCVTSSAESRSNSGANQQPSNPRRRSRSQPVASLRPAAASQVRTRQVYRGLPTIRSAAERGPGHVGCGSASLCPSVVSLLLLAV